MRIYFNNNLNLYSSSKQNNFSITNNSYGNNSYFVENSINNAKSYNLSFGNNASIMENLKKAVEVVNNHGSERHKVYFLFRDSIIPIIQAELKNKGKSPLFDLISSEYDVSKLRDHFGDTLFNHACRSGDYTSVTKYFYESGKFNLNEDDILALAKLQDYGSICPLARSIQEDRLRRAMEKAPLIKRLLLKFKNWIN